MFCTKIQLKAGFYYKNLLEKPRIPGNDNKWTEHAHCVWPPCSPEQFTEVPIPQEAQELRKSSSQLQPGEFHK
jgi:hypothetical protein